MKTKVKTRLFFLGGGGFHDEAFKLMRPIPSLVKSLALGHTLPNFIVH